MNQDPLYQGITQTLGTHGVTVQGGFMSSPVPFFPVLGLLVLAIVIIGLLIDRSKLTKEIKVCKGKVMGAFEEVKTEAKMVVNDVETEAEKIFRPGELTIKSLQAEYASLQTKITLAEKELLAELAGIEAQAQAAQTEAVQLSQLKATLSATQVAPAPAPASEAPGAAPAPSP